MSPEWSAVVPFLLCAMSFAIGVLLFPGPKTQQRQLAPVIELTKFRRAEADKAQRG